MALYIKQNNWHLLFIDINRDAEQCHKYTDPNSNLHIVFPCYEKLIVEDAHMLLKKQITTPYSVIFHFNMPFGILPWTAFFRNVFPKSKIICAVHYFSWCFVLNGNKKIFNSIIYDKESWHPKSEMIYKGFIENQKCFSVCDRIIALCQFAHNHLINDFSIDKDVIDIIPNGIESCIEKLKRHNYTNCTKIVYVGRIDVIKGVHLLTEAFLKVIQVFPHTLLYIVGDAKENDYMRICHKNVNNIIFCGRLCRNDLLQLYNDADIGVLPSFHEQCSYTAIEMMAHALPIVSTNTTGMNEMLDDTPENRIYINEDHFDSEQFVQDLANKIIRLIKDIDFRCDSGEKMYELYKRKYTLEKNFANLDTLISKLNIV